MERIIFFIFLCMAFEGDTKKHIYVPESLTWLAARDFCRENYTELSFVSSQTDQDEWLEAAETEGWIGLQRDDWNKAVWKWSGGGNITYQSWDVNQPGSVYSEASAYTSIDGRWDDVDGEAFLLPFYCVSITIEDGKKTWEDAQNYCRQKETHLTSLLSETEHLLTQKTIQKVSITERVWIGLRYLHDRWLWVKGDPLVYEAWPEGTNQDHQCPIWKRCGTLTKDGLWENWDCRDKLNFICY